jgi:KaiC/GvpD/RAD55 family RecA-like ATPase
MMSSTIALPGPHAALPRGVRGRISTGIEPLDERWGGLTAPGVYVVAGAPGSRKLLCILHFLQAGITAGRRVALLSPLRPEKVLEEAEQWGFDIEPAWARGQLRLISFKADFQRRVLSAAVPSEVYEEFDQLLEGAVDRIGIDPGAALWETHAGSEPGARFVEWAERRDATILATVAGDLDEGLTPSTEWVAQTATGILHMESQPNGLLQLSPRRLTPSADGAGPLTLEAVAGRGLAAPSGKPDRRRTDASADAVLRLYLLSLTDELAAEVSAWADKRYDVTVGDDPLQIVEQFQTGQSFGRVLIYLDRGRIQEAVRACRVIRSMSAAPIFLASDDVLRSADRVRALEAGATDVLSGHPSMAELEARISRAESRSEAAHPDALPSESADPRTNRQVLARAPFVRLALERLGANEIFALVRLSAGEVSREALREVLATEVRHEEGDQIGELEPGFAVLLEGIRRDQAQAFLTRVRAALPEEAARDAGVAAEVLSSVTDAARIRAVLGRSQPKRAKQKGSSGSAA